MSLIGDKQLQDQYLRKAEEVIELQKQIHLGNDKDGSKAKRVQELEDQIGGYITRETTKGSEWERRAGEVRAMELREKMGLRKKPFFGGPLR